MRKKHEIKVKRLIGWMDVQKVEKVEKKMKNKKREEEIDIFWYNSRVLMITFN